MILLGWNWEKVLLIQQNLAAGRMGRATWLTPCHLPSPAQASSVSLYPKSSASRHSGHGRSPFSCLPWFIRIVREQTGHSLALRVFMVQWQRLTYEQVTP